MSRSSPEQNNLTRRSEIRIPINIEGHFVDPAEAWRFAVVEYNQFPDGRLLAIKAEPVNPNEAQRAIVSLFTKRRNFRRN